MGRSFVLEPWAGRWRLTTAAGSVRIDEISVILRLAGGEAFVVDVDPGSNVNFQLETTSDDAAVSRLIRANDGSGL